MQLRTILIPAEPTEPIAEHLLDTNDPNMSLLRGGDMEKISYMIRQIVGGFYEMITTLELCQLQDNPTNRYHIVCMLVDEDGHPAGKPINPRASRFYPHYSGIAGDVLLVGRNDSDRENPMLESLSTHVTPALVRQHTS